MSARPVLLAEDEALERARLLHECESSTALAQYLAELIVLRKLFAAAKRHNLHAVERELQRLNRPSLAFERAAEARSVSELNPPAVGGERLL